MAPIKPRARLITDMGRPFWVVFAGPVWRGYGRCGRYDGSLEGAYQSWLESNGSERVLWEGWADPAAAHKAAD